MDHHVVTLLGVAPDDFFVWLSKLKTMAEEEQQRNPYRPQSPPLQVLRIDPHHIPLPGRREGRIYQGLYIVPPGPSAPFGHPVVVFSLQPQTADRLRTVLGYLLPGFPLDSAEIVWLLEQRFPHVPRLYPLVPGQRVELDLVHADRDPDEHWIARPGQQGKQKGGAPVLVCNLWLRSQLEALPDLRKNGHLYKEWVQRYSKERGYMPSDSRKSFRESVRARIKEIQWRRGDELAA